MTSDPPINGLDRLFLAPSGWRRSRLEQSPMTADGAPLPWMTYAAIEWLQRTIRAEDRVFEYGAGNGTLWWQSCVNQVVAVEHDAEWCARVRPGLSARSTLLHRAVDAPPSAAAQARCAPYFQLPRRTDWPYDDARVVRRGLADERCIAYAHCIEEVGGNFDIIVIDGMARRLCTYLAMDRLTPDGMLILDNSNRSDYTLAFDLLSRAGFRQVPLWGLVPGADFHTCTSVFIRTLDRLPSGEFASNRFGLPEY